MSGDRTTDLTSRAVIARSRDDECVAGRVIQIGGERYELAAPTTEREADAAEAAWAFESRTLFI